jgi:NHL repeat
MRTASRLAITVACTLLASMAGASSEAWGKQAYEAITGTFGKACEATPCPGGQFDGPTGVAVGYKTGDVYVVDSGDDRVEWFNANGSKFEGQFDGSGAPMGKLSEPEGIAVDNDPSSPSYGDVYVVDAGHHVIDKFSETGEYIGDLEGPFDGLLNVGVDAEGNAWVYEVLSKEARVWEYNPEGTLLKSGTKLSSWGIAALAPGFAVDAKDDLYVTGGGDSIYEYENANTEERKGIKEPVNRYSTLAVISSTGHLLVDEQSQIELFGSPPHVFPGEGLSESAGIAVNGSSGEGTLYASQRSRDDVAYFEPPPPAAPEILSANLVSTSREGGQFEVVIDPNNRNTTYEVEYSTEISANGEELEGEINRLTGTELPAEFNEDKGTVAGAVIEPVDASYYYRVIATNEIETTKGEIKVYTKLPSVLRSEVLELTSTGAAVASSASGDFVTTTYTFYIADKYQYEHGESVPMRGLTGLLHEKRLKEAEAICSEIKEEGASGTLPAGTSTPCPVTAEIEGLTPGETYYFRVVATNGVTEHTANANKGAPVVGEWVAFTPYPPPLAVGGQASAVTDDSADLSGEVNPEGAPGSYYFAYIAAGEYEQALKNGAANPAEPGYQQALEHGAPSPYADGTTTTTTTLPAVDRAEPAGPALATGLLPATTYDYALVATNRYGLRTYGPDRTFKTQPNATPTAATGPARNITQTTAVLTATVTTAGEPARYAFEVTTDPTDYGVPTGQGTVPAEQAKAIEYELDNLEPATTYHYRVTTTTTSNGTITGREEEFTTPPTLAPASLATPLATPLLNYTPPSPKPTSKPHPPTPAEQLAKSLKSCHKYKSKTKRHACEQKARSHYRQVTKKHKHRK